MTTETKRVWEGPSHSNQWPEEGDRCQHFGGWTGTVLRRINGTAIPQVTVEWDEGFGFPSHRVCRTIITKFRRLGETVS